VDDCGISLKNNTHRRISIAAQFALDRARGGADGAVIITLIVSFTSVELRIRKRVHC
jgi:hypothetical protein